MLSSVKFAYSSQKLAPTQTYELLDGKLVLVLRAWGSTDYNQKFVDEVMQYLSSAEADLELTTPFDFHDGITSLANKLRVSLLMAHDYFYKNDNKSEYTVGFESLLLYKKNKELAWATVGRFNLDLIRANHRQIILKKGSDLDGEVLLPMQMVGVEKDIDVLAGSIVFENDSKLLISSVYKCDLEFEKIIEQQKFDIEINNLEGSYWYAFYQS
jgi:hypothetical protein